MILSSMGQETTVAPVRDLRAGRLLALGVISATLVAYWYVDGGSVAALASLSSGAVLILMCLSEIWAWSRGRKRETAYIETLKHVMNADIVPAVVADGNGAVLWSNPAADALTSASDRSVMTVGHLISDHITSSEQVLRRIKQAAQADGMASETVVGMDTVLRLHVRLVSGTEIWRFEIKEGEREDADAGVPSILLGRNGVVLSMNEAARSLVGTRAKSTATLFRDAQLPSDGAAPLMTSSGEVLVQIRTRETGAGRTRVLLTPIDDDTSVSTAGLEDIPLPAMRLSPAGKVLELNGLACILLKADNKTGCMVSDLLEGLQAPVAETIEQATLDGIVHGPEILRVRGADTETFVQMNLKRVMGPASVTLVAIMSDATELKTLEAQFVQGQKMQAIGQLAGGVAHDFNNLLTAISGHCDLMLLRHDQGDQDYADLIQIHQNANRAAALVTQLLAFSRKQTLQPEHIDLRDTLSDLTHLLNRLVGEKVSLMLSHDPVLRPIRADKRQLEQVIMNLVVNARDAMPDGGQISIETESLTLREPLIRDRVTVPEGDYVVVRVRDQGGGIHPDVVPKIFEPFFTTKRTGEGTGLGLSTAYGIVKQTGGFIFVDSQLGQGTCFSLMFAAQTPQARPVVEAKAIDTRPVADQCEGVVLLVEDEAPVRAFASRALAMRGFEVLEAALVAILSQRSNSSDSFLRNFSSTFGDKSGACPAELFSLSRSSSQPRRSSRKPVHPATSSYRNK